MRPRFFLAVVLVCVLLSAGCLQAHSPGEKTPANLPVSVGSVQSVTSGPATSPELLPRYQPGDIIDQTTDIDRMPHFIILGYNTTTREYQYDIVFRSADRKWYRNYPQPLSLPAAYVEKKAPYLLAHIPVTDLSSLYPSREDYAKTL
jgi:hypothetical protein